jgi:hypothetical protein
MGFNSAFKGLTGISDKLISPLTGFCQHEGYSLLRNLLEFIPNYRVCHIEDIICLVGCNILIIKLAAHIILETFTFILGKEYFVNLIFMDPCIAV